MTLPDAQYGEAKTFNELQQQAPLAQVPQGGPAGQPPMRRPQVPLKQAVTPLSAPTQRPDEPVTAGAALGPGPGPEVLGNAGTLQGANYTSGRQLLSMLAAQPAASPQVKGLAAMIQRQV